MVKMGMLRLVVEKGDRAVFAKVKVRSADEAGEAAQKGLGEIEIQFSPLRRP